MSDNAKTFKHCSKEIVSIAQAEEVHSHLTNKQIERRLLLRRPLGGGGLLGETGSKCQALSSEDHWIVYPYL